MRPKPTTRKTPKKKVVLKSQSRKMVFDVYCFIKKLGRKKTETLLMTADATQSSIATVKRIVTEANKSPVPVFRTPGKKKPGKKKVTGIDDVDKAIIRQCLLHYHVTKNELPTIVWLFQKLKEDLNFPGSERSFRRILQDIGFRCKKLERNRRVLVEKPNIRFLRIDYLQKLNKYREEGRPIVYTDTSFVDTSPTPGEAWSKAPSNDLAKYSKTPISKGQRIVIVHAGSEAGFVPNALQMFNVPTNVNHDNKNFVNYEEWVSNLLIPNLPPNSVLVIDNSSYRYKQDDPAPTENAKKTAMQKWLRGKGIEYTEDLLKPQLFNLIKLHREQHKKFKIEKLLSEHNHAVLWLPPCHPDLNPIKNTWSAIKDRVVNSKDVTWNVNAIMELVTQKVAAIDTNEWQSLFQKVKETEAEYAISDRVVDLLTDRLVFAVDDESESEDESEDSDDAEDEDESDDDDDASPMSTEPTPSTWTIIKTQKVPNSDSLLCSVLTAGGPNQQHVMLLPPQHVSSPLVPTQSSSSKLSSPLMPPLQPKQTPSTSSTFGNNIKVKIEEVKSDSDSDN